MGHYKVYMYYLMLIMLLLLSLLRKVPARHRTTISIHCLTITITVKIFFSLRYEVGSSVTFNKNVFMANVNV